MHDPIAHEGSLLVIQRALKSWYSMIPLCVTMNWRACKDEFRNNGEQWSDSAMRLQFIRTKTKKLLFTLPTLLHKYCYYEH